MSSAYIKWGDLAISGHIQYAHCAYIYAELYQWVVQKSTKVNTPEIQCQGYLDKKGLL